MGRRISKPPVPDRPSERWQVTDRMPLPEVVQSEGESAWALWHQVAEHHEAGFAPTEQLSLPMRLKPDAVAWAPTQPAASFGTAPPRTTQSPFTLENAILVARRNNRVCPMPECWIEFTKLLPPRKTQRGALPPPPAATGAAWEVTPSLTKRMLFREQLEWAERTGVLAPALAFMQAMAEDDWLHMGER
jgi:hypothetical protein